MLTESKKHLIPLLLMLVIAYRNSIPEGYVVAGGDFLQWFSISRHLLDSFSIWSNEGKGYAQLSYAYFLFYAFLNLFVDIFNLKQMGQSALYYLLFLMGSYLSFYTSLNSYDELLKNLNNNWRRVISIGYSLNIFTFYNFYGLWGFSPFFFLYILFPLILAYTYSYVIKEDASQITLAKIGIIFFLVNIANGNFAFFVSLNIILFLFILILKIIYQPKYKPFKKLFLLYFIILTTTSWSVIPQLIELIGKDNSIASGETVISLSEWVLGQAVKFPDPFLIVNNKQVFLINYPLLLCSSFILLIATIYSLVSIPNLKNNKKFAFALFAIYLLVIFMLNKGVGFLPIDLTLNLFANVILGSIRSFHKTIIFLPFFLYFIVSIGVSNAVKNVYLIKSLILLSIFIPIMFFIRGGILSNFSFQYPAGEEDYKTSIYSPLIKIPSSYKNTAIDLNKDKSIHRILSAPYYLDDEKYGWMRLPEMKYKGSGDPIWPLFNSPFVLMNDILLFKFWNFGNDWSLEENDRSAWLPIIAGLINVKYILVHNDIDSNYKFNINNKFLFLENNNFIKKISNNKNFSIYKIEDKYFFPRVYVSGSPLIFNHSISEIKNNFSGSFEIDSIVVIDDLPIPTMNLFKNLLFSKDLKIDFNKVSSSQYRVKIDKADGEFILILSEAFNNGWGIYTSPVKNFKFMSFFLNINNNGHSKENLNSISSLISDIVISMNAAPNIHHFNINGNSNGWFINVNNFCLSSNNCIKNLDGTYTFEVVIMYWTEIIFKFCFYISVASLFVCLLILFFNSKLLIFLLKLKRFIF
jgi:hypothetical protein